MQKNCFRQYLKAVAGIVTAVVLCAGYVSVSADAVFAESEQGDLFAFRGGLVLQELREDAKKYPDHFDLRNVDTDEDGVADASFITPVKAQNPFGSCWGFSVISAAESSILSDKTLNKGQFSTSLDQRSTDANVGADGRPILDLSEKQIVFFATGHIDDPSSSQNGEGMYFRNLTDKQKETSSYRYETGGVSLFATSLFAAGVGPVIERTEDPKTGEPLTDLLAYKGAKGESIVRRTAVEYDADGKPTKYARKPVWYSEDDDWSLPDSVKDLQSFRIKDAYRLPILVDRDFDTGKYTFNKDALNVFKQQLCENHRAISIAFCAESYLPGQDTSGKKYMSKNWAHYTNVADLSNHAVTIVGWDDNYPKENFLTPPDGDGAFLIKNSWGSELNEFPNNGYRHWGLLEGQDGIPYDKDAVATSDRATGYFWLSYYDKSLSDPEVFTFIEATPENDYDLDQYDYVRSSYVDTLEDEDSRSANVFTCRKTSVLKDISIMTTTPGTEVTYAVYALPSNFADPEAGVKIAEGQETFDYGGYHRINVVSSKVLAKGQKYSVVVKEVVRGGGEEGEDLIQTPYEAIVKDDGKASSYNVAVVNKGESFLFFEEKWQDISKSSVQESITWSDVDAMDNFPIKAYLKPVEGFDGYLAVSNWQDGTPGSFALLTEEQKTLTAEFRGLGSNVPEDWDPEITWTSSNEDVVKVTPKEGDYSDAVIEGIAQGKAYITVDAGEYGSRIIGVNVSKPAITSFDFDDDDKVYTGKAIKPKIENVFAEAPGGEEVENLVKGKDYKVTYKKNVKPGKATVTVTGIGKYRGSVSDTFVILKAKNKMKASGRTVTLKLADLGGRKVIKNSDAYKVKSAKGKVTYSKVKLSKKKFTKKFSVNKKTGDITVKKGVKKGSYTLTVKVRAAGDKYYKSASKKVKVKIKVV